MKAYRITTERGPGGWDEMAVPHAGPTEIVLETSSAGLCRTDLELMDHGAQYSTWIGPFTVGHETAGRVIEVGSEVVGFAEGDPVLVHSNSSCGRCRHCMRGKDNFCLQPPPNYGYADNGGLAPVMKARQRDVVQLRTLDPRTAAPLADAGATGYGALLDVRPYLQDDGYVAVIGVGGVGGVAVQLLKQLTGTTVIAVDRPDRLALAAANGADHTIASSDTTAAEIMDLTHGRGVDATVDIVGTDETLLLSAAVTTWLGAISLVGLSGGTYPFGFGTQGRGARVFSSTTCSLGELARLVSIVERTGIEIRHESFAFDDVERGYDALRAGKVDGRALIDFTI
jgi:propanol-preferring alcohol dehydrogenase